MKSLQFLSILELGSLLKYANIDDFESVDLVADYALQVPKRIWRQFSRVVWNNLTILTKFMDTEWKAFCVFKILTDTGIYNS